MLSFTTGSHETMFSSNGINGDMNVTLWPIQVRTSSPPFLLSQLLHQPKLCKLIFSIKESFYFFYLVHLKWSTLSTWNYIYFFLKGP